MKHAVLFGKAMVLVTGAIALYLLLVQHGVV